MLIVAHWRLELLKRWGLWGLYDNHTPSSTYEFWSVSLCDRTDWKRKLGRYCCTPNTSPKWTKNANRLDPKCTKCKSQNWWGFMHGAAWALLCHELWTFILYKNKNKMMKETQLMGSIGLHSAHEELTHPWMANCCSVYSYIYFSAQHLIPVLCSLYSAM